MRELNSDFMKLVCILAIGYKVANRSLNLLAPERMCQPQENARKNKILETLAERMQIQHRYYQKRIQRKLY